MGPELIVSLSYRAIYEEQFLTLYSDSKLP